VYIFVLQDDNFTGSVGMNSELSAIGRQR